MISFSKIKKGLVRRLIQDPAGMGRPVPKELFDEGYRVGHWDLLNDREELPRSLVLAGLVTHFLEKPSVLDVGCGNGHLLEMLRADGVAYCAGVDLSTEGIKKARARGLAGVELVEANFEAWTPGGRFDAIIFNESIGYARDPAATLRGFSGHLTEGKGLYFISYFRSGNYRALWRRIGIACDVVFATSVVSDTGKAWDIKVLRPRPPGS